MLFRIITLINVGALPIFVIEGEAPSIKWNTMSIRNQARGGKSQSSTRPVTSVKSGKRTRFKSILREVSIYYLYFILKIML